MDKKKNTRPAAEKTLRKKPADGGRVFRNGMYANLLTVIALVAAILLGLVIEAVPDKYTAFDLSDTGVYTLSDTTKNILSGLSSDVKIYYLAQTGSEDAVLTRLLDRYADSSSHIQWEEKDPALYPSFVSQYDAEDATEGSLLVVCGDKKNLVDANDIYPQDYSNYYTTGSASVSFDGENALTTAIFNVTSGESSTAYYVTNHGETAPESSLTSAIEAQNITLTSLDMLANGVPEDCDLLIMLDPQSDLTGAGDLVDETAALEKYLAGGGKLILLTDPEIATPNLDSVMAEYGLSRVDGTVIEGNSQYYLNTQGGQLYLLPDLVKDGESGIADGLTNTYGYLVPKAQGIAAASELPQDVTTQALLTTSSDAFSRTGELTLTDLAKQDGDIAGPFNVAMWASNTASGAQVVWVGSGLFGNLSSYDVSGNNSQFLLACAATLTDQSGDTLVDAKALESDSITVNSANVLLLGAVFLLIVPAVLIITGVVITILRRRK